VKPAAVMTAAVSGEIVNGVAPPPAVIVMKKALVELTTEGWSPGFVRSGYRPGATVMKTSAVCREATVSAWPMLLHGVRSVVQLLRPGVVWLESSPVVAVTKSSTVAIVRGRARLPVPVPVRPTEKSAALWTAATAARPATDPGLAAAPAGAAARVPRPAPNTPRAKVNPPATRPVRRPPIIGSLLASGPPSPCQFERTAVPDRWSGSAGDPTAWLPARAISEAPGRGRCGKEELADEVRVHRPGGTSKSRRGVTPHFSGRSGRSRPAAEDVAYQR
jgi:hypothetical protein